jgi:hypothetical protein
VPAEIEGGVRREAGDQNGQSDEIRIVCAGNDHRDRANLRNRDQRETNPPAHLQLQPAKSSGALKTDVGRYLPHALVREHQDAPSALSSQGVKTQVLKHRPTKTGLPRESAESRAKGETVSALARRPGLIPQELS